MYHFKLMLSIHTGWKMFEIDTMPVEDINGYYAMNCLNPFTYDAQASRDGLLITETFNQRRKKQLKSWDILPYLKPGTPDWLSDETVKKARTIISNIINTASISKQTPKLDFIYSKIEEEVEIERAKDKPDTLKIKELLALIKT